MKLITAFTVLTLIALCLQFVSGCAVFPDPVASEMEEDPNSQTNNFL